MPTTVLLIRHPESAWNQRGIYQGQIDTPLSQLGKAQAERVANRLRGEEISGVICSPLRRARLLGEAIASYHSLSVQSDERLTEIAHGSWEGLSRDEVRHRFPEMYEAWISRPHDVRFPGGESLQDVHGRSVEPVADLLGRKDRTTWVIVTHDTVARLVVAAAREEPVHGFSSVSLENAAITTLVGPNLIGSVQGMNDVEHLGEHRVNLGVQAL